MRWQIAATGVSLIVLAGISQPAATAASAAGHRTPVVRQQIVGPSPDVFSAKLPVGSPSDPAASKKLATKTHLTATRRTSKYDTTVTFRVRVTAGRRMPTGRVLFADASMESYLAVASLHRGTATFSTAALAPGTRRIIAAYLGNAKFRLSVSAEVVIKVAAAGTDSVAYQVDPAHDGNQARGHLHATSLAKKWTRTLSGPGDGSAEAGDVSYPVIAGGRVFVTVENAQSYGTVLYALSARTGATDWSVGLGGTYGFSALAYDGQRLFALNYNGVLTAFTASTGHEDWSVQLPVEYAFTAPPTAFNGVVYVSGSGTGGAIYAVSEAGGALLWGLLLPSAGDKSSPAVDTTGIYLSYACQHDFRFRLDGRLGWYVHQSCSGGGGSTAVLHGNFVYARGASIDSPLILTKSKGRPAGSFASHTAPAFAGRTMFTLQNGVLVAVDASGSPNRWSFGNGNLVTAPVVSNGTVYVGASNGTVYGVSASKGKQVWTGMAGSVVLPPDEQNADVLIGMSIGGGLLVVPAGSQLTAFGD
ncbi:MAG: PQQ-binding-like beta-propeller repeat protein [Streptosporangiaceae bacterium]